ncbi:hypothetical protein EB796_023397 [Bugula neritina]|nr:hypothetical protein EB796_023397 [Bugula neritina]
MPAKNPVAPPSNAGQTDDETVTQDKAVTQLSNLNYIIIGLAVGVVTLIVIIGITLGILASQGKFAPAQPILSETAV